ncbi:CHAT domain-containing protein, partial [Trichothermofontia sp.]
PSPPPPPVQAPPEIIQIRRPELPIVQVPPSTIDTTIRPLEETFTRQFTDYFGQPMPPIRTRDEIQAILAEVERNEGIKPAIVYISFIPATLQGELPGALQERRDDDQLELVVLTREGPPIRKRLPSVRRAQLIDVAQDFRLQVAIPDDVSSTEYLPLAQRLYQWLIAPIAADLAARKIDNLVFIPDVGLRSLPFAALHDGQQFLIERYSVGLMPTVSLADTRYKDVREVSVLAMGLSQAVQGQQPLPATPSEINGVLRLWPGRAYLDQDLTRANLIRARRESPYGIVHLATHGDFSPGNLANAYIQFWNDRLPLDEIRNLGFSSPSVELLVLSACRTALGNEQAELGFAGLAYQAGVKTAVASLWYVSDAATAGLMTDFYATLKQSLVKAEALRRAQVNMATGKIRVVESGLDGVTTLGALPLPSVSLAGITTPDFSHPFYWAAFTTIGTPW